MFFNEYDNQDGYQVWLDQGEVETLLAATDDSQHRLAFELGAHATVPALDVTTRTLRRWIDRYGEQLADETGEEMWRHLGMHDLRRTWATSLKGADVDAMIVCDWGGWSDLETFLDHYRGKFSPEQQRKQRGKVDWL